VGERTLDAESLENEAEGRVDSAGHRAGRESMKLVHRDVFVCLSLCLGLAGSAQADVIQLVSSKDNTLIEGPNAVSDGAGLHFFAGTTIASTIRRGLIAFDIAGNIPAGSTVQSARLQLHMSKTIGPEAVFELHQALANWGEGTTIGTRGEGGGAPATAGDATWLNTFWDDSGSPPTWANPGGDFRADASASTSVAGVDFYTFAATNTLAADVQFFLDNPQSNFGWVLIAQDETAIGYAKRFDTRENSNPSFRPLLTVEFTPP